MVGKKKFDSLGAAAGNGDLAAVKDMVARGWDVNEQGKFSNTPLHVAVYADKPEVMPVLLSGLLGRKGADPNRKNRLGDTPLGWAAIYGRTACAKILLDHGADPETEGNSKVRPLHYAALTLNLDVTRMLIEHGADPNCRDSENLTPLITAMSATELKGLWRFVRLMVANGADVSAKDNFGRTVREVVIEKKLSLEEFDKAVEAAKTDKPIKKRTIKKIDAEPAAICDADDAFFEEEL